MHQLSEYLFKTLSIFKILNKYFGGKKLDNNSIIYGKAFNFALKIIEIYKYLMYEKSEYVMSKQMLRSGTSVGANVKEALRGQSRKDFSCKMNIALKEANETEYWLELLIAAGYIQENEEAINDCREICRILHAIVKTVYNQNSA